MKETMEFILPGERIEHRNAMQGGDCRLVLWELDQEMRSCIKHGVYPCGDGSSRCVEEVLGNIVAEDTTQHWRDRLYAIADDYGIRLDEE